MRQGMDAEVEEGGGCVLDWCYRLGGEKGQGLTFDI